MCDSLMLVTDTRLVLDGTVRRRRLKCPTCGRAETRYKHVGDVLERWHKGWDGTWHKEAVR